MKIIKKVIIKKTLRCDKNVWVEGTILPEKGEELHPDVLAEVYARTGIVKVLEYGKPPEEKKLDEAVKAPKTSTSTRANAKAELIVEDVVEDVTTTTTTTTITNSSTTTTTTAPPPPKKKKGKSKSKKSKKKTKSVLVSRED